MRFQNTAYMTNGFSERIPAAQKLMILDGVTMQDSLLNVTICRCSS